MARLFLTALYVASLPFFLDGSDFSGAVLLALIGCSIALLYVPDEHKRSVWDDKVYTVKDWCDASKNLLDLGMYYSGPPEFLEIINNARRYCEKQAIKTFRG